LLPPRGAGTIGLCPPPFAPSTLDAFEQETAFLEAGTGLVVEAGGADVCTGVVPRPNLTEKAAAEIAERVARLILHG
jgi:hypothetical protein